MLAILTLPVHYCSFLNCESFAYNYRCCFFVRNSCMAPMFSFEWNKEVLRLTMSIPKQITVFASNLSSSGRRHVGSLFANEEQKRVGSLRV